MNATLRPLAWLALAAAAALVGCGNPSADVRIEALGPEAPGVEPSENHRPGQPCVLCHSAYGGAEPEMAVGGTIYSIPTAMEDATGQVVQPVPVFGATVILFDAFGTKKTATSNCVGNFWIPTSDWEPAFPIYAEVSFELPGTGQQKRTAMSSWIQRDGSCATCHAGERNQGSTGRVFLLAEPPASPFPVPPQCGGAP